MNAYQRLRLPGALGQAGPKGSVKISLGAVQQEAGVEEGDGEVEVEGGEFPEEGVEEGEEAWEEEEDGEPYDDDGEAEAEDGEGPLFDELDELERELTMDDGQEQAGLTMDEEDMAQAILAEMGVPEYDQWALESQGWDQILEENFAPPPTLLVPGGKGKGPLLVAPKAKAQARLVPTPPTGPPPPGAGQAEGEPLGDDDGGGEEQVKDTLHFDKAAMAIIIGPYGQSIKQLRQQSGATVRVVRSGDYVQVHLEGSADQIQSARAICVQLVGQEPVEPGTGEGAQGKELTLEFKTSIGGIIGPGGAKIREVREKSSAEVLVRKVGAKVEVRILGTAQQVEVAKQMVTELAASAPVLAAPVAPIAQDRGGGAGEIVQLQYALTSYGAIIGKGGEKITDVRQKSGADVKVSKATNHTEVDIRGNADQVQLARSMIAALAGPKVGGDPSELSATLHFDQAAGAAIVAGIRDVRQRCGGQVEVRKTPEICQVMLFGSADQVETARALIHKLVEEGKSNQASLQARVVAQPARVVAQPDGEDMEETEDQEVLAVSRQDASKLIGQAGASIKRIRTESGAAVKVDPARDPAIVAIRGTVETVDRARVMVREVLRSAAKGTEAQWEAEEFLRVSSADAPKIIGKAGANLAAIEKKTWAKVEVDGAEGANFRLVRISGAFDYVDKALSIIEGIVGSGGGWRGGGADKWSGSSSRGREDQGQKRKWSDDDWKAWRAKSG